jgi:RimJ/RimL family protein N-acetyltransferase
MSPILRTRRLLLRPVTEADLLPLSRLLNDWDVAKHLGRVPHPYTLDDALRWHASLRTLDPRSRLFAIAHDGALIGAIGYEVDRAGDSAELGYWLAQCCWRNGYMREAAGAVIAHAFARSRLDRLTARCQHANEPSRRLLAGLGFRHLGHARSFSAARKEDVDVALLELTQKEWLRSQRNGSGPQRRHRHAQNTRLT